MISKLKALGLAFVAVTALSAMAASVAQAGTLDIGADPAVVTGHSDPFAPQHQLRVTKQTKAGQQVLVHGGSFNANCQTASFEGTITQDDVGDQVVHEGTVTATYGTGKGNPAEVQGCTLFGQKAQVLMDGCTYTLTGEGQPDNTALIDIVGCTQGTGITIQSAFCQVHIPPQPSLAHVVGSTIPNSSPHEVTLEANVTGITHTQTGSACPDGNGHHSKEASFSGSTIVKAYVDNGNEKVKEHGHEYEKVKEGQQVNITST